MSASLLPAAVPVLRRRAVRSGRRFPAVAAAFLALVALATAWPHLLSGFDPIAADPVGAQLPPGAAHWFGTDQLGRDVFSRVVHGARYSVLIGAAAVAIAALAGTVLGLFAGLLRGAGDEAISRALDVVSAFPDLLLVLVLISFTGPGITNLIVALGAASIPRFARMVRAQTLVVAGSGYVEQARTFGLPRHTLVFRHILPHAVAQVPVLATIGLGSAIISAAGLSFLGMGPPRPAPEWGSMLAEGRNYLRVAWWISVWPGLLITLTVLSVNALGRYWQVVFDGRRRA